MGSIILKWIFPSPKCPKEYIRVPGATLLIFFVAKSVGEVGTLTITTGHNVNSVIVTENGVVQRPTTDYTVSGTTLTFGTAPASGVAVRVKELLI